MSSIFILRFEPIAAAEEETASFMAVISSAILLNESVRADVSAESLMVLSFILISVKTKKGPHCEILYEKFNKNEMYECVISLTYDINHTIFLHLNHTIFCNKALRELYLVLHPVPVHI